MNETSDEFGVVPPATALSMSGLEFLQAIRRGELPAPPVTQLLDYVIDAVEPGRVTFTGRPHESQYNILGTVHGGVIGTLLDSAMGCAVHTHLEAGQSYTTLELKVNYVRAVTVASGPVTAEGRTLHVGRRTATAEGRLTDATGRLMAHATTTCIVVVA